MDIFLRLRAFIVNTLLRAFYAMPVLRELLVLPLIGLARGLHLASRLGLWVASHLFLLTDRWASRHMEYRADTFAAALTLLSPGATGTSSVTPLSRSFWMIGGFHSSLSLCSITPRVSPT